MDRKDARERGIIELKDNFPGDKFGYLLTVFTSERANSGTTSNVGIQLIGSQGLSNPHILNHDKNLLQLGQDNWFLIYTEEHIGEIKKLHVWHDNSGPHPDWFCSKIMVYDLTTDKQYLFPIRKWLSITTVNTKDWKLEFMLEPEKYENINWRSRAKENFFAGLREAHIWFSIFVRHPRSSFTRRQRLTVGLIIILISMLSSIMFYGAAQAAVEDDPTYSIGTRELIAILQATIISVFVSVLAAKLFMLSWPDKEYVSPVSSKKPKIIEKLKDIRKTINQLVSRFLIMDPLLPVQLEPEKPLNAQKSKKKKAFLIVAWTVNSIIIATCSFFLVMYGLKLGPNKSIVWTAVVLMNIGKAIFITQPLKIIILSLLVAVFLKTENRDQLIFEVYPEGVDESLKYNTEFMAELLELRSRPMYHPLTDIDVMVKYQMRKKVEKYTWNNINFIFVSVIYVFLIIIVMALSSNTSPIHTQHILDIVNSRYGNEISIRDVHSRQKLFKYLVDTLIPSLHEKRWYNNDPLPKEMEEEGKNELYIKGWFLDYANKVLGVPRLRQLRVSNDGGCVVPYEFSDWYTKCNNSLSKANIEKSPFGISWIKKKPYDWNYSSPTLSESLNVYGASGCFYPGGGYIQNLTSNSWDSLTIVTQLNISKWLDGKTRLIILEFNLFNVNSKLFSLVTIVVECLASGVMTTRTYVDSAYHEFYMGDLDVKLITVLSFLVVILILSVIRMVLHVSMKGLAVYFSEWQNTLDFLIIFFGFTSIIAAIKRAIYFKTYSRIFEEPTDEAFVNFAYPFYQDDLTAILLCLFIVFTTIRLCGLCHYGKYYYTIRRSLSESLPYISVILLFTLVLKSLLTVLMYSCGAQTQEIFPALPVPRVRFKNFEPTMKLQAESILHSTILNYVYLFSGIFMTSVFIYFYGKARHRLLWYGEGLEFSNRFQDLYLKTVKGIGDILAAVKGDNTLRLKGGSFAGLKERTDMCVMEIQRALTINKWEGYQLCKVGRQIGSSRSETVQEAMQEMTYYLNKIAMRYGKMCKQLDMVAEIIQKQTEEENHNV